MVVVLLGWRFVVGFGGEGLSFARAGFPGR